DFATPPQLDAVVSATGLEKHAIKITAVHHGVRILETLAKRIAEVDVHDLLRGERVHQAKRVDVDRHRPRSFANPQVVKGVERVGAKLNAGSDFTKRRSLFEHQNTQPLLRETQSGGQASDPAAGDGDRLWIAALSLLAPSLRQASVPPPADNAPGPLR